MSAVRVYLDTSVIGGCCDEEFSKWSLGLMRDIMSLYRYLHQWRWPMKKFDALKWIRKVRDDHHEQQRNLTAEQKIEQTKAESEAFRASRHVKKASRS